MMSKNYLVLTNLFVSLFLLFYFMGNNAFEYLPIVYYKTISIVICVYVILFVGNKWFKDCTIKRENVLNAILFFIFIVLQSVLLDCTLLPNQFLKIYGISYVVQLVVFFLWYSGNIKKICFILILLTVFNCTIYLKQISFSSDLEDTSYGIMEYKPNIYLIVLESYQGNEALKKLYYYDNDFFIDELKKYGFHVYDDVYSNAPTTRASLSSIFTLKDLSNIPENTIDSLLTMPDNFKLTNTFIQNGYSIEYMFPTNYLTQQDSRYRNNFYASSLFIQRYLKQNNFCAGILYNSLDEFVQKISLNLMQKRDKPLFFITKIGGISENDNTYVGGVMHIPNMYKHSNKVEELPNLRKNYINELKQQNKLLLNLLKKIQNTDPDGLVVLIGDHGGSFIEIYKREHTGVILPFLKKNKIDKEDFLLDFFNVFLAIKWPKKIQETQEIHLAAEVFKVILEKLIPNLKLPPLSLQLFDFDNIPLTDIFIERKE